MGTTNRNSRRGFFFTVMALALLSFMLLAAQVWVRTFEQKDEDATVRFKGEAMRLVLSTLSDNSMSEFANASAFYATYKLVSFTETEGLIPEPAMDAADEARNPGTGRVVQTIKDLMINGTSSPSARSIAYSPEENESYTVKAWQGKIESAANVMGFNASFGDVENFSFRQDGPWTIAVHFEMQMNISDLEGTMRQSKRLKANVSFPINGFEDPMITRNELSRRPASLPPVKQIWKHLSYNTPSSVAPRLLTDSASEGYGWFFGPLAFDYPGMGTFINGSGELPSPYILVHSYDDNLSSYADSYGAVIVTTAPNETATTYIDHGCNMTEYRQGGCLNCLSKVYVTNKSDPACSGASEVSEHVFMNSVGVPMIQSSSNWSTGLQSVSRADLPAQKFVLIDNEHSSAEDKKKGFHKIWDITPLRDMTVCGFYVHGGGPSFFQRMVAGAPQDASLRSPTLGIESFMVGKWAGGADDQGSDMYSRLDWEFYSKVSSQVFDIKGMPGCKNYAMCSATNATKEGVGKFKLSGDALGPLNYNAAQIACRPTNEASVSSPCGD